MRRSRSKQKVTSMITREQYMQDSKNLHQQYYLEMAQTANLRTSDLPFTLVQIREAIKTDKNLNNLPLDQWDRRSETIRSQVARAAKIHGAAGYSLCNGVCMLKAFARHLAES